MPLETIDAGNKPRFTFRFYNTSGTLTNPTTVTVSIADPAGTVTNPSASNVSTGVYTADATAAMTLKGTWTVRVEAAGAVVAAAEEQFVVRPSKFY